MCRLLMADKAGVDMIEQRGGLLTLLDFLEKQCGGHGNGVIFIKNGKVRYINKGMSLANESIVKLVREKDYDWFMYHTRVASAGSVKDRNCHPYWNKDKSFAMMMNGTEQDMAKYARKLDITDTELVFKMIAKGILPLDMLTSFTANYMGFFKDFVYVANNKTRDPLVCLKGTDSGTIIASDLPYDDEEIFELKTGMWKEGEMLEPRPKTAVTVWRQGDPWFKTERKPAPPPQWTQETWHAEIEALRKQGVIFFDESRDLNE